LRPIVGKNAVEDAAKAHVDSSHPGAHGKIVLVP